MAILAKGIRLVMGCDGWEDPDEEGIPDLMEIPELGNKKPEQIDVTTLASDRKEYMDGLDDFSEEIGFKFLYSESTFGSLSSIPKDREAEFSLKLPGKQTIYWIGTLRVVLNSITPNTPMTFTLYVKPVSAFEGL